MALEGKYVTKDEESAFNHFLLGATYYDETCTLDIVDCYQNGVGIEKNEEIAFSYLYQYHFHKSQSVPVMYEIILCYLKGKGVKKDIVKASYLLNAMIESKQSEVDISEAEFLLGYAYYTGSMTLRNPPAAFYQFSLAAQNGHIDAMFYLAECYDKGTGISVNHEKAISWYMKAAEKQHSRQHHPAELCEGGSAAGERILPLRRQADACQRSGDPLCGQPQHHRVAEPFLF